MQDPRSFCLSLAFGLALFGSFAAFFGIPKGRAAWRESAYRASLAALVLVSLAGLSLLYALAVRDYRLAYVVEYTSNALSTPYALSAFWAGNDGSLLLWAWMLIAFTVMVTHRGRKDGEPLWPGVLGVLLGVTSFFLILIATPLANPFRPAEFAVPDGQGMNPLLQNPGMIFHPPALYVGYVAFTVPFAYALATLIQGRREARWFERTRRWSLFAWFFLSLGNVLGAWWAYVTLGWGGYWAWDPVENAGFLPWLTGTAYLHSVMVEERKGMLRVWNIVLIVLTFLLTIFGTFLTRSGVLSSVHAFGESKEFAAVFLAFLALSTVVSAGLLLWRLGMLKNEKGLESALSREASVLLNNVVFVGAAFIVFWGTIYPLFYQLVRGQKIQILADWFNRNLTPVWVVLLLLTGLCPLLAWRKGSLKSLVRGALPPLVAAVVIAGVVVASGVRRPLALALLLPVFFLLSVMTIEYVRGVRARMGMSKENAAVALWRLVARNPRRYGGYVVHIGVAVMVIGVVGSSLYNSKQEVRIPKGQSAEVSGYKLVYKEIKAETLPDKRVWNISLDIERAGKTIGSPTVVKEYYPAREQWFTKPTILSTGHGDFYVTLAEAHPNGNWVSLEVRVNPLTDWIWMGGIILLVGTLIAAWKGPTPARAATGSPALSTAGAERVG